MKLVARIVLGLLFIVAGVNHLVRPRMYMSIMPDYLPWHRELVAISGYMELLLGGLVMLPRWHGVARWGLIALLLAIFPANIHMVVHPERYSSIPAWALWLRLPLQGVLIAWVWWATKRSGIDQSAR